MKRIQAMGAVLTMLLLCSLFGFGQQQSMSATSSAVVPPLVKFSGTLDDSTGKPLSGVVGVTFLLYEDEQGGAPLWLETQNVIADKNGHYTVMLGSTTSTGLPTDIFVAGEARWLAVQPQGQGEQPRVLLLSVPYALKAGDSQTLGGLPASAFVQARPSTETPAAALATKPASTATAGHSAATSDVTTSGGTANTLPLFTTATNVQSSIVTQTGSAATGKIGINTTAPATMLDVNGAATVRGTLTSPATGTAAAAKGFPSQPQDFVASVFNSSTATAVSQKFQWQAEPAGNDTSTASGTINLLYASGAATPAETGLHIGSNGLITFAAGQIFTGTAQLGSSNTFTGTQTIKNTTIMTGSNPSGVLQATNTGTSGTTVGVSGTSASTAGYGVEGQSPNVGVFGNGTGTGGIGLDGHGTIQGVKGISTATTGAAQGVYGQSASTSGFGVEGESPYIGTYGQTSGTVANAYGVYGLASATSGAGTGVFGLSNNTTPFNGAGVLGQGVNGVVGTSTICGSLSMEPSCLGAGGTFTGFSFTGSSDISASPGVEGTGGNSVNGFGGQGGYYIGGNSTNTNGGDGVDTFGGNNSNTSSGGAGISAWGGTGPGGNADAGDFAGNVDVEGTVTSESVALKIDHPLDPANKYLVQASVNSSEMINIYTGNVTTDAQGEALVNLPDWFEVVNTDFRYQLTVIGQFAQAIISHKIENHHFQIRTNAPNVEVSWQITGVRQDAYAKAHPLVVEEAKEARLKGYYIHPEFYGAPAEQQIEWARRPQVMKKMQQMRQARIQHSQAVAGQPTLPTSTTAAAK